MSKELKGFAAKQHSVSDFMCNLFKKNVSLSKEYEQLVTYRAGYKNRKIKFLCK